MLMSTDKRCGPELLLLLLQLLLPVTLWLLTVVCRHHDLQQSYIVNVIIIISR